ncbi:hypothetical protein FHS27_000951 [Rhodopirellula rubra]|uniref:Uncharacterized protein n=1 Tax=Aporhodopirellula rubra TaxID=980271 RepID=A0A7W5DV94_9BACT|nr:hypothetical protein [Aporhodopirellula rubra]
MPHENRVNPPHRHDRCNLEDALDSSLPLAYRKLTIKETHGKTIQYQENVLQRTGEAHR